MLIKEPEDLRERAFRFTCDIYDYCRELDRIPGLPRRIAFQLFDAGASVGANLQEAKSAYSRREFAAKNAISLKECREATYWLRVAQAKALGSSMKSASLLREVNELTAILASIVKRLKLGPPR